MAKVIQVRGVPDDVRDTLAASAAAEGLSLTSYLRRELQHLAGRSERARANAAAVLETRERVGQTVERSVILDALHEGRRE